MKTKIDFRMPNASKWRTARRGGRRGGTILATGTRITVRDQGFVGRSEAADGNAEHWERVLGWPDAYLSRDSASVTGSP